MRDPRIEALRARIAALDLQLLTILNARIETVRELKAHKETLGLPFLDPDQERRLVDRLVALNEGPLTEAGVRALFEQILAWTKHSLGA